MDRPELRPLALFSLAALVLFVAATALADVMVETDEERLDDIASAISESGARIDRLAAYADAERVAVVVGEHGHTERVGDSGELVDRLHEVLAPLDAERSEVLNVTSELAGDEGSITLRVRDAEGTADLELTLRREGQSFLLVAARRLG